MHNCCAATCSLIRYDYNDFCLDVSKFPTPRFISEFGFQSYPSFSSLKKVSQTVVSTTIRLLLVCLLRVCLFICCFCLFACLFVFSCCFFFTRSVQDWTNDSPFMTHRNHHPGGNKQMEALIALNFNLPVK